MRIQKINTATGDWHDVTEPETWIRLEINGVWYEVQEDWSGGKIDSHGLRISCNGRVGIMPIAANAILVLDSGR